MLNNVFRGNLDWGYLCLLFIIMREDPIIVYSDTSLFGSIIHNMNNHNLSHGDQKDKGIYVSKIDKYWQNHWKIFFINN